LPLPWWIGSSVVVIDSKFQFRLLLWESKARKDQYVGRSLVLSFIPVI
jgi:hypothetical protein